MNTKTHDSDCASLRLYYKATYQNAVIVMSRLTISLLGNSSFLILWKFLPNCRIPFAKRTWYVWYVCVCVCVCGVCVCAQCVCEGKEGQGECERGLVLHKVFCKFSFLFTHNKNTCFHKTGSTMGEHAVWNLSWYKDTEST